MNLYPHDCSYLFTEYGRRKAQECYEIENRPDDGKQEGNGYKHELIQKNKRRDNENNDL